MAQSVRFFGSHISIALGFKEIAKLIEELGINAVQIHPSAPQRWVFKEFTQEFAEEISSFVATTGVKLFFHGIYLINLASANEDLSFKSILAIRRYLQLAEKCGAEGVVFHPGSITDKVDKLTGLKRVASRLKPILDEFSSFRQGVLLEVSAGKSHVVGSSLSDFRTILDLLDEHPALAVGLDTQHLWASGYDLLNEYEQFKNELKKLGLIDLVRLIHINDSKSECGSTIDRHENVGKGRLGAEFFKRLFHDKDFMNIPMILETPAVKDLDTLRKEVARCKSLIN